MAEPELQRLFPEIQKKMQQHGAAPEAILSFRKNYARLLSGDQGVIREADIEPASDVLAQVHLAKYRSAGQSALSDLAVIKLNGGLGTSMGLESAKSLIPAHRGLSFLDITIEQIRELRNVTGSSIPLLFMNSFRTSQDTEQALAKVQEFVAAQGDLPTGFLQNQVPKISAETYEAVSWSDNPELEWCPPGHGDIYTALQQAGIINQLLERGVKYLFISNSDNLGAVVNADLLGYLVQENIPFLMEVAQRTESDRKGGHLARGKRTGNLLLRETAQCHESEQDQFQDIQRYSYFNTNSLWVSLEALKRQLEKEDSALELPLIRNLKNVDPNNPESPKVYQLENAMGSAISLFEGAQAVCVERSRFAPVKTTDDLLAVRSDAYELSGTYQLQPCSVRPPFVKLDRAFYTSLHDFDRRFPHGAPSLKDCTRLEVTGDVLFGKDVICEGVVKITNDSGEQVNIADGSRLSGDTVFKV